MVHLLPDPGRLALGLALLAVLGLMGVVLEPPPPAPGGSAGSQREERQGQESARAPRSDGLLRIDESMFHLAAATGGDFYFWEPGEFATADLALPLHGEPILLATGELVGEPVRFTLPVDALFGELQLFAGMQSQAGVRITSPSGTRVTGHTPGVLDQEFVHMRIATVQHPEPGTWTVLLEGTGRFMLSARASMGSGLAIPDDELQAIQIFEHEFVELRGRPGHQGYFPLREPVRAGEPHALTVCLMGSYRTAELSLVGSGAEPLDVEWLEPVGSSDDDDCLWVGFVIPDRPFRLCVSGLDLTGSRYQRVTSALILPDSPGAAPGTGAENDLPYDYDK